MQNSNSNQKKKKLTSALAVVLAAVLLIGGASYAYLEDSDGDIVNSFNTNKVEVEIDETTGEDYNIVPGTSQDKDPTVTVDNTVDAYVFVRVTDNTEGLVTWDIADGWTLLDGTTDVYYRLVGADDEEKTFSILDGDKVYYSSELENSDMLDENGNLKEGIELTFSTYAIQAEGFDSAVHAFAEVNDATVEVMTYDELVYAVQNSEPGTTVVMINDITGTYTMRTTVPVTIDLDGNTLTINASSGYSVITYENLVITNGDMTVYQHFIIDSGCDFTLEDVDLTVTNGASLYISGTSVTATIDADSSVISTGNAAAISLYPQSGTGASELNVYGTVKATVKSTQAISENYWSVDKTTVNIYDGAYIEAVSLAIYKPDSGEINVYGGTITGYSSMLILNGVVNVYGGEIIGTADDSALDNANGIYSNTSYDGSAIVTGLATGSSYYGDIELNIYGGTITSDYSYSVRCYATSTSNSKGKHATVNLYGGTYNNALGDVRLVDNLTDSNLGFYTLNDER